MAIKDVMQDKTWNTEHGRTDGWTDKRGSRNSYLGMGSTRFTGATYFQQQSNWASGTLTMWF